ncbi:MAG: PEP-CTERM sorting domain-containing protein [Phycisphaerales bacterium]|nr:PEP-CTERM sorting domain-containing protein [Phycisphaerales bacterium]
MRTTTLVAFGLALLVNANTTSAVPIFMTVLDNVGTELGGLTFRDGDVANYEPTTDTATLFFSEDLIAPSADLTALHIMPNGDIILSVLFNNRTLGGLTFNDGDLVRYNPNTDTATIFGISEASFTDAGNPDISAVYVRANGNILVSTLGDHTLGGLAYTDGDIIEYDPVNDTGTLLVAESAIFDDGDGDIDALHLLPNGNYVLSATLDETISGTLFGDGDLVEYNPGSDTASLFFNEGLFTDGVNSHDVNGVWVAPEPSALALLALGGAMLLNRRRR